MTKSGVAGGEGRGGFQWHLVGGAFLCDFFRKSEDFTQPFAICREEPVDLQLPETNTVEEKLVTVHAEPKIKFREKTVSSLSRENLPAVFRKKKKGIGYKNLKPRTDDL